MKEFLKSGKMIVSAILAVMGAIAATIAILQFAETKPSETWILKRDGAPIDMSANSGPLRDVYQADIVNVLGDVLVDKDIAIIANEIVFKDGASLNAAGANVTLIATRIRGGTVKVTGVPGVAAGQAGAPGGSIFAVTALLNGSHFFAEGGTGAPGLEGSAGKQGVPVECTAAALAQRTWRDDEKAPNDGAAGAAGGAGGTGGAGGLIKLYAHPGLLTSVRTRVDGGMGGAGGPGGAGGAGVAGCSVFSFSIEDGDEGEIGPQGAKGAAGKEGRANELNFDFRQAGKYLKAKLESTPLNAAAARQVAELAAAAGLAE